jgi:hypothetical protein
LWDHVKRVCTGVKSVFGVRFDGNASEVEVVGGARMGGRKARRRKQEETVW